MKRFSVVIGLLALGLSACDSEGIDRVVEQQNDPVVAAPVGSSGGNSADDTSSESTTTNTDAGTDTQTPDNSQSTGNPPSTAQPVAVPPPVDNDASQSNDTGTDNAATQEDTNNSDDEINMFGGSGSSDGGQSNPGTTTPDNTDTDSDTENTDTDANDDNDGINMFGGSGSSDGGENGTDTPEQTDTTNDSGQSAPQNDAEDTSLSLEPPTSGTTFVSTASPIHYGGPECSFPNKDENGGLIFNGNCPTIKRAGNVAFGDFLLANNTWNDCASAFANWTQCISVDDSSGKVKARWDYDWGNESDVRGAVWLVKSYPEVIYGVKSPGEYSAPTLAETVVATGLPAKVSNLPFYKISYTASSEEYPTRSKVYSGQTINGERNIAIESFFHELGGDCDVNTLVRNASTSNQRFELMVWVDAGAERLPAAPNDYVTTTSIDGQQYDVYTKPSDREYIAFVAQNSRSSADLNWNSFIEWSREYSHRVNEVFGQGSNTVKIQDDWCLANILLGTEIWWGNGFFQLDDYSIQRTVR